MTSAKFSRSALAQYIVKSLDKKPSEKLSKEVAAYILEKGKTGDVDSLLRDVAAARTEQDNIVEVTAVTAHPLTNDLKRAIEDQVKNIYPNAQKVIISSRVDPAVIGGIRLEFNDKLMDLTAAAKLNKLKALTTQT